MACKFKIGDKVRANEKSNDRYSITNLRRECEGIVVNVVDDHKIRIKVTFSEYTWAIGSTYDVNDKYFDLISNNTEYDKNELHITVKGRETIGVYKHDGKTYTAVAECSPQDIFDFATGVKLVCERLGVLPVETVETVEPVNHDPYTGKMICIESGYPWWTVGKIYNVVNGKVKSDDGDIYPHKMNEYYTSAEDCRHIGSSDNNSKVNLKNEFIPIVE